MLEIATLCKLILIQPITIKIQAGFLVDIYKMILKFLSKDQKIRGPKEPKQFWGKKTNMRVVLYDYKNTPKL